MGLLNARAKGKQIGRPRKIDYDLILNLRRKGFTYLQISQTLKISQGTVSTALKNFHPETDDH